MTALFQFVKKHHRLCFYTAWIILAVIQASFTELQDDEAYYWVYSMFPAWGYFDHPPMIALLIKAGSVVGHNELAVRLFPLILNVLTLYIVEKLIVRKQPFLFYAISLSLGILHIAGFFAVPDIPLIFFTALMFLVYKSYLNQATWSKAMLLGFVAACLLYSKYHGALIIFFILLSNLQLLRDRKLYFAGIIAFALFLPHLWWQYNHHWATLNYQLVERSSGYDITYTTDYVFGQLLLAGPIAGLILLPATFLYGPKNKLEKALKFTAMGLWVFFLLSSFKGRVEANWTAPVLISIIVLGHQFLLEKEAWKKWLYRLLPLSIVLIFLLRIITIVDILPIEPLTERYFAWKGWPGQLRQKTDGLPVVFKSNYQRASKYWFYTGQTTYSLNSYADRQNNYNFWPLEDSLLGKRVVVMDIYKTDSFPHIIQAPLWKIGYGEDSNFYSFVKIEIVPDQYQYKIKTGGRLLLKIKAIIPDNYLNYLKGHPETNPPIMIGALRYTYYISSFITTVSLQDLVRNPQQNITITPDLSAGPYNLYIAIKTSTGNYTRNSQRIKLTIE